MSQSFAFNEKYLSQIPALQLLINLGYTYLLPAEALEERQNKKSNVILENILTKKLKQLNKINFKGKEYLFSEENIQTAVQKLKNIKYDGLVYTNEQIYDLITLGTSLEQTIDGNKKSHSLQYIDWHDWENNDFHVTAEFSVERTRSSETARPDIVLFVNGIPFTVIECKKSAIDVEEAVSQNIRNQLENYIPKLFIYTQLIIATNKNHVKYGTTGTSSKFWSVWHEKNIDKKIIYTLINTPLKIEAKQKLFSTQEFNKARYYFDELAATGRETTEQDVSLYSLCRPDRLLDLTYQFIVFDGGVRKIARYQQYFAVKKILDRIQEFEPEGRRKGGVVWHTQGSGKSLTMVMLAKALALDPNISKPRIILVSDRKDLDKQLKDTFISCDLEPQQAKSGRHLLELLEADKTSIITTIINKFAAALNVRKFKKDSANIFILVDESHRTQYGKLHPKMKQMFPKGCYIGFTGTPLTEKEKNTANKFGGIIDKYTIKEAVGDKAVVPLIYEGRHGELEINNKPLDNWFDRYSKGLTTKQKIDLKKKYSRASNFSKAEQVVFSRAFDLSEHYRQNWQGTGFKAQLVAPDKRTALQYQKFLDEFGYVSSEVIISAPDSKKDKDDPKKEKSDELVEFWNDMMERYGSEKEYNDRIIESFKKGDKPEILIVVDKLLTGFDAPVNTVLYITRTLKKHTLLQAIARVNRLYANDETGATKEFGYIIDYEGVLEELEKALAKYSSWQGFDAEDLEEILTKLNNTISKLPQERKDLLDIFKTIKNKQDEEAYERLLADEKIRDDFYEQLARFSKTLAISLSSEEFITETPEAEIKDYERDLKRFQNLKAAVKLRYSDSVDYRDIEPKIRKLLDIHLGASEVTQIVEPVNIFDDLAFSRAIARQKSRASQADFIASLTKRTITEKMDEDPAFYRKFSQLLQQAIDDYRDRRISEADYLNKAREVRQAVVTHQDREVPEAIDGDGDALAYWGLIKPFFTPYISDPKTLEKISVDAALAILQIVRENIIVDWVNNAEIKKGMMNAIDDYFYDVVCNEHHIDLSSEEMDAIIDRSLNLATKRFVGRV